MPTLTYLGETFSCDRAQKGKDYVRLLDSAQHIVFFADGISDFSDYVLTDGEWETPYAVIAPTVSVAATLADKIITLAIPEYVKVETGLQVNFTAPCDCTVTEYLQIGGENYTIVDALGECVTGKSGRWAAGATVSVILDGGNKRAYLQNGAEGLLVRLNTSIADEYVWRKMEETPRMAESGSATFYSGTIGDQYAGTTITMYPSCELNDAGTLSLRGEPVVLTVYVSNSLSSYEGYYIEGIGYGTAGKVFKLPANAKVGNDIKNSSWFLTIPNCKEVYVETVRTRVGYVNSPDSSAYPPAVDDGFAYDAMGQLGVILETSAINDGIMNAMLGVV